MSLIHVPRLPTEATDGLLRRLVIPDMLRRQAARQPRHLAIVEWTEEGARREISYGELDAAVNRVARRWIATGLRPGMVVAAFDTAKIEYVVAYYATMRCGATFTAFNPVTMASELAYFLGHARPWRVLHDGTNAHAIEQASTEEYPVSLEPMANLLDRTPGDTGGPDDDDAEPVVDYTEDDIALLVYTSGTESRPKGVMVTHRAFMAATSFSWVIEGYLRAWDRFLVLAPMHTMAGLGSTTNILNTGATLVYAGSTSASHALRVIHAEKVTNMSQTPAFYRRLLTVPEFDPHHLASLEQCHTYGGLAQAAVFERLSEAVPTMTWATYWGQTELSQLGSIGYFRSIDDIPSRDARWIGRPTAHLDIRVVDDNDRDQRVGELIVRSPAVMAGYLNDPAATEATLRDGWLRTGDIVEIDEHYNLFFHDRRKDMIKTGGMNVSSLEVEQVLFAHPAVAEAAVVGLPSEEWSEEVTAFVVPNPDVDISPDELRKHCRSVLSPYKVPKTIRFMTALPRDAQGKVRKRELRDSSPG